MVLTESGILLKLLVSMFGFLTVHFMQQSNEVESGTTENLGCVALRSTEHVLRVAVCDNGTSRRNNLKLKKLKKAADHYWL
jgi:hypothetical protein